MVPPVSLFPVCSHPFHFRTIKRLLNVLLLCLVSSLGLYAQDGKGDGEESNDKTKLRLFHSLEGGLTLGGQLSNESFVYKSGLTLQYGLEAQVSSRVYYGLGLGVEKFNEETFFPLFASFKGMLKKKDNTPFLAAQFGYALATNRNFNQFEGYDFDGGVLFSPGFGYRFSVGDKFSGLLGVYYKHQFAKNTYKTYEGFNYRTTLNYDLISFRVGIML